MRLWAVRPPHTETESTMTTTTTARDHAARDAKRTPEGRQAQRLATLERKAARTGKRFIVGGAR